MGIRGDLVPLVLVVGALALALLQGCLNLRRRWLPMSPWWLGFTAVALVFVVARIVQRSPADPDTAIVAARIQYVAVVWVAPLTIGAASAHSSTTTKLTWVMAATATVLSLVLVATPWMISGPAWLHDETIVSPQYYSPSPHWMLPVLLPYAIAAGVILFRHLPRRGAGWGRRRGVALAGIFIAASINDLLLSADVIHSLHLLEYAFGLAALWSSYFVGDAVEDAHTTLEAMVAARTESLEAALAKLAPSEARYQQLADATHEGVIVTRGELVTNTNRALRDLLGATAKALDGVAVDSLFTVPDHAAIARLIDGTEAGPIEAVAIGAGSRTIAVQVFATNVGPDPGDGRVILVRDISGQKELQQQLLRADRLASVGTLAAGTAHEINNPLTYVMANLESLRTELGAIPMGPGVRASIGELVHEASDGAQRIRAVVRDLMTLARERETDEAPVDVWRVLDSSLAIVANQLRHRARVVRDYEPVSTVVTNEARLGQVFLNLLVNAVQAIPDGHADDNEVRVRVRQVDGELLIEIADTGCGMDEATRDRIFDPFFTTKDVGQGTGLGLAISLGIVSALGGRIDVTSSLGVGTTFCIWLPTGTGKQPIAKPSPVSTSRVGKILIVDDEPLVARSIARMLRTHDVTIAGGGQEALARCRDQQYDLVLCDLMMPDMSGMELHDQAKRLDPALAERFVFVTGGAFSQRASTFLETTTNRWLAKPIDRDELQRVIVETLANPAAG